MPLRFALLVVLALAGAAGAQQLYRWTDENGRVNITDTPPPASARNIQQKKGATAGAAGAQQPFQVQQAAREFPVVLYTAPGCGEPCSAARALLNKRGVPFKEVQVRDDQSNDELKQVSGADDVPVLVVGRSAHRGYAESAYDALLDSARYPRAGLVTPRAQAAPPEPGEPETTLPSGPYAPRPPRN